MEQCISEVLKQGHGPVCGMLGFLLTGWNGFPRCVCVCVRALPPPSRLLRYLDCFSGFIGEIEVACLRQKLPLITDLGSVVPMTQSIRWLNNSESDSESMVRANFYPLPGHALLSLSSKLSFRLKKKIGFEKSVFLTKPNEWRHHPHLFLCVLQS